MANLQTEIWVPEIAEKLYPDGSYTKRSVNDSAFVTHRTVNLAQAGQNPSVVRNRNTYPATATQRGDTNALYDISEYTSDPTLVTNIEEIEVSYAKRQSVILGHARALTLTIHNQVAVDWSPANAANIIRTTGAARAAQVAGATGNRKMITLDDIFKLKQAFDDMDIDDEGRCLLLPSYMYNDLMNVEKEILLRMDFTGEARVESGSIKKLLGFDIYTRGKKNVLQYTNAANPVVRAIDATASQTANVAALAWHQDYVRFAEGDILPFYDENNPIYYGSIFSALARAGGKKWYSDETGVMALVESAA